MSRLTSFVPAIIGIAVVGIIGAVIYFAFFNSTATLNHGTVTSKEFQPAHQETELLPITVGQSCSSTGGQYPSTICTPIMSLIPYEVEVPDRYVLRLQACDDPNKPEKCKTGSAYVDPSTYDSIKVGSYFTATSAERKAPPVKKLKRVTKTPGPTE